ncbi:MAG: exopolysaccharide biosynthesis polyprenyl glycosylphosphotransferase [Actinomycetota bacterium]|nr:exopolysaccharide biosynthesis polyprenyl glycosylphosphotransferase [Actinomycetota bacterium]
MASLAVSRGRAASDQLECLAIDIGAVVAAVLIGRWACAVSGLATVSLVRAGAVGLLVISFLVMRYRYRDAPRWRRLPGAGIRPLIVAALGSSLLVSAIQEAADGRPSSVLGSVLLVLPALALIPAARAAVPRRIRGHSRVIVVGTGRVAERLAARLKRLNGVTVIGQVDDNAVDAHSVVGGLADLRRLCIEYSVDVVLVAFSTTPTHDTLTALRALSERVSVSVVPRLFEMLPWGSSVDDLFGIPVIHVMKPQRGWVAYATKRAIDIGVAGCLVLLLSPLLLLVALAVRLSTPGPVMFRQTRTGLHGRPFSIFKFRTMTTDAEQRRSELAALNEVDGPVFKMRQDPRITRLGSFLRQTSIDELPQLLNVIRGEMSLVGPRPLPVDEAALVAPSGGISRTAVRPGITGLWQVSGRSCLNYDDLAQLDAAYAASWSIRWDVQILLRTPGCVLRKSGAY